MPLHVVIIFVAPTFLCDSGSMNEIVPSVLYVLPRGRRDGGCILLLICTLGVKVRNLKMDFNTGGTWRWVGQ